MIGLCVVVILPRSQSQVLVVEVYLPILAYLAFSFSAPPFLMYVIPFALIQIANLKGYKVQIVFLSIVGCLWTAARSPDYLFQPLSYLFYVPC